jgi:hypothetical protein
VFSIICFLVLFSGFVKLCSIHSLTLPCIFFHITHLTLVAMPQEHGRAKHDPKYYHYPTNHRRRPQPSLQTSFPHLSTTYPNPRNDSSNEEVWGTAIVEEGFSSTLSVQVSGTIPAQVEGIRKREGQASPWGTSDDHWGVPIIEEAPLMVLIQEHMTSHAWLPEDSAESKENIQCGLTSEQLQLIFEIRRDVADQQFQQESMGCGLDALFDSLSGKPTLSC